MEVIVLTTLFSVLFAALFLLLFLRTRQNSDSCADQDALIPFRDDDAIFVPAKSSKKAKETESNNQPNE